MLNWMRAGLLGVALAFSASAGALSLPQEVDETAAQADGFSVKILATTDKDWREKWDTPPEHAPHFSEAEVIGLDENVVILLFFINPGQDAAGKSKLVCDVKAFNPDGGVAFDQQGVKCFDGALSGNPHYVYLSPMVIEVVPELGDKPGIRRVEITVQDTVRNVSLTVRTKWYEVIPKK